MPRVLIVGAGQIGSRHLQAFSRSKNEYQLDVVDPSPESLQVARERFEEASGKSTLVRVGYWHNLDSLPEHPSIAIVATSSDVRREVVQKLVRRGTRQFVLEKFLFQSEEDFDAVGRLFDSSEGQAWVNCGRRMWPFYQSFKEELKIRRRRHFEVTGTNWGLACNSIHFIDLISYLSGLKTYVIEGSELDDEIIESKRKGFVEFFGILRGRFDDDTSFELSSEKGDAISHSITISFGNESYVIDEKQGVISEFEPSHNRILRKERFDPMLQSQLTETVVSQILLTGNCDLTGFKESAALHLPLLKCFLTKLRAVRREEGIQRCPIT